LAVVASSRLKMPPNAGSVRQSASSYALRSSPLDEQLHFVALRNCHAELAQLGDGPCAQFTEPFGSELVRPLQLRSPALSRVCGRDLKGLCQKLDLDADEGLRAPDEDP
jgi:hypothetical protein